jgi:hypothetical protein
MKSIRNGFKKDYSSVKAVEVSQAAKFVSLHFSLLDPDDLHSHTVSLLIDDVA